jgi:hypothetical protein
LQAKDILLLRDILLRDIWLFPTRVRNGAVRRLRLTARTDLARQKLSRAAGGNEPEKYA